MARVCMSSYTQIGKMRNQRVFRILLLYNILETVYRVVQATDGRVQGFMHTEGELSHFVEESVFGLPDYINAEDVSSVSFTDLDEENLNTYASPVSFQPAMLDFKSHHVGMPHMERVIVKNLSPDTSIHMLSISGNALHLYCSFFQEKIIPPGGNTTFDVVFLARYEGSVENTLFIHTSLGSFKYQVSATGTLNPYRLRPYIGVRMPLNSSYTPVIHMHNPHSSTLQLTEMYTSGGDLHLELPDGENEAPRNIWQIPPYETRSIIKANFIARVEKNHTSFIRISTNGSDHHYLVLPVEVDVTSVPGIYSPTEVLDFGILRSHDPPKALSLSLLNSGQKHVHIVNVIVTPVNEAVDVKFIPVKVPPMTIFSTQIATVTFNPARALHEKQCSGKIVIKSKNNQFKLQIPYQVQLLKGSLFFNNSSTRFYVGSDLKSNKIDIRDLNITNTFNVTIIIYNLSLPEEAKPHFKVSIKEPVVLTPGETLSAAWLTFQPAHRYLQLTTYLRLHTNISYFDVPLLCYSGHLKVFLPHAVNESIIDFGTLGMGDKRTMIFAVINENPVDVNLKLWGSNTSKSYVELVGIDKGNASTLVWRHNFSSMAHSLILKPHHYAIFRIGITSPLQEGILNGHAFVETQHEKINVPFSLRTAKGGLKLNDIDFGNTFPGKISSVNVFIHSSFSHSMTITGVTTLPEDPRFVFDPIKVSPSIIYPNSQTLVGKAHFDLRKQCRNKCYSGLPATTSMGHQWLQGMPLPPDVAEKDKELFNSLYTRWKKLVESEGKSLNFTMSLDTTEVRGHLLKASAVLNWPRLFSKQNLKFPITQIGNCTVRDFTLENPSSLPLIVQVLPLYLYPKSTDVTNLLVEKLGGKLSNLKRVTTDADVFTLEELEDNNQSAENHIPTYRKSVEEYFGVQSHKQSIVILLTPGMRVRIQIGFRPKDDLFQSSLILIRNNLTVLDALLVQGQGGHGEIKFGNLSPGAESALIFELTDKHLKDCDGTKNSKFFSPNFTVRKPFTARNTGPIPIYIQGFDISGKPCEAYGFRVLNCEGFELKPNESRRIDIAFTPDFTLTKVDRALNIHISGFPNGHVLQFLLIATIPRHMLAYCTDILPRPFWELFVYYIFNLLTICLVFGLLIFAHLDSQKLLKSSYFPLAAIGIPPEKMERGNVFDLKALNCSTESSSVKVISCRPIELKKKEINHRNSEISSSSCSSSSSSSSQKRTLSISKSRDLSNIKDYEDTLIENTARHNKKKAPRLRQPSENYVLEPEFVEIRKSQPRNSWTRFLKPPFTFNVTSPQPVENKPSVATQTSNEENEESFNLKNLELPFEPEVCDVIKRDSDIKVLEKVNEETQYIRPKSPIKKANHSLPEEETSSTTTETSTAESDISEKDHQLPDVCVTTKIQKSRLVKTKSRDRAPLVDVVPDIKPIVDNSADGEGFELSTKSRGHKKIKVDPNKVFGGDIHQPSTLELPYKPKPVIEEQKKEETLSSDESRKPSGTISYTPEKPKAETFEETPHQASTVVFQPAIRQSPWSITPPAESPSNISGLSNNSSESPTSYSEVLSRDISSKAVGPTQCNNATTFKVAIGPPRSSVRPSSNSGAIGQGSSGFNSVSTPQSIFNPPRNDFSSSKLNNWMSNNESFAQGYDPFQSIKSEDTPRKSNFNDVFGTSINSIWNIQPLTSVSPFSVETQKAPGCQKEQDLSGVWSNFDLSSAEKDPWDPEPSVWNSEVDNRKEVFFKEPEGVAPNLWDVPPLCESWNATANIWSSPLQNSNLSPVGTTFDLQGLKELEEMDRETSPEFNPFHTLSNLWSTQSNTNDDSSFSTPSNRSSSSNNNNSSNWSFSLFSEPSSPRISDSILVRDDKKDDGTASKNLKK